MNQEFHIVECPRDAMQGIHAFIPTETKIRYLNALLKVGFQTLDFGSFVSPKAIPQLADTPEVISGLDLSGTSTRLLAIVANFKGAELAVEYEEIAYLGYPFSISETFQQRNTNRSITDSIPLVQEIQDLCIRNRKELVVYLSMGFGNPYGDLWEPELLAGYAGRLHSMGIRTLAIADTIGCATPAQIRDLFPAIINEFPHISFGAHFHSTPNTRTEKIQAALDAGCRRFDVALKGFGGCPFAADELTGNLSTESLLACIQGRFQYNQQALAEAAVMADEIFGTFH